LAYTCLQVTYPLWAYIQRSSPGNSSNIQQTSQLKYLCFVAFFRIMIYAQFLVQISNIFFFTSLFWIIVCYSFADCVGRRDCKFDDKAWQETKATDKNLTAFLRSSTTQMLSLLVH
jgi:hypothetical protein